MKILISVLILAIQISVFGQGVILTTGQSYVLTFDSVSHLRPASAFEGNGAGVAFVNDGLDLGESMLFEIFAGGLTNTPFSDLLIGVQNPGPPESPTIFMEAWQAGSSAPPCPSLQGAFRVTMISGTVDLSSFLVSQVVNGNYYSQTFAVPEPATITLVFTGTGILFLMRGRTRRPPNNQRMELTGASFQSGVEPARRRS